MLPPRSRQLLLVLSVDISKKNMSLSMSYGGGVLNPQEVATLGGGGHIPALDNLGAPPCYRRLSLLQRTRLF